MEDEYMIFESKMNHLTLEELNTGVSLTRDIIINKLYQIKIKSNIAYHSALNKIGQVLVQASHEKPIEALNLPRGVFYDSYKGYYVFQVFVNKKRTIVKRSANYQTIMKAYKDFHYENKKA